MSNSTFESISEIGLIFAGTIKFGQDIINAVNKDAENNNTDYSKQVFQKFLENMKVASLQSLEEDITHVITTPFITGLRTSKFSEDANLMKAIDNLFEDVDSIIELLKNLSNKINNNDIKGSSRDIIKIDTLIPNAKNNYVIMVNRTVAKISSISKNETDQNKKTKMDNFVTQLNNLMKLINNKNIKQSLSTQSLEKLHVFDNVYWQKRVDIIKRLVDPNSNTYLLLKDLLEVFKQFVDVQNANTFIHHLMNFKTEAGFDNFKKMIKNITINGMLIQNFFDKFIDEVGKYKVNEQDITFLNDKSKLDEEYLKHKGFKEGQTSRIQYLYAYGLIQFKQQMDTLADHLRLFRGGFKKSSFKTNEEDFTSDPRIKKILTDIKTSLINVSKLLKLLYRNLDSEEAATKILDKLADKPDFSLVKDLISKFTPFNPEIVNLNAAFEGINDYIKKAPDQVKVVSYQNKINSARVVYVASKWLKGDNQVSELEEIETDFDKIRNSIKDLVNRIAENKSYILAFKKDEKNINLPEIKRETEIVREVSKKLGTLAIRLFKDFDLNLNLNKDTLALVKSECLTSDIINRLKYEYFIAQNHLDFINGMNKQDKSKLEIINAKKELEDKIKALNVKITKARGLAAYNSIMKKCGSNNFKKYEDLFIEANISTSKVFKNKEIAKNLIKLVTGEIRDFYKNTLEIIAILKDLEV
ncbi:MAG: hypothetical protein JW791_02270 [Nanoarchaeota archaeon]|nr:hypothetical protein [Nanoarchaeota archaeon]